MVLRVLTNEIDKDGKLIEQLIVSQQEEDYYIKLAEEVYNKKQNQEYKAMGLPFGSDSADEKRAKVFRSIVFFHNVGRWVLISLASLFIAKAGGGLLENIQIGFKR